MRSGAAAGALVAQPQDFELLAEGYRRLAMLSEYLPAHPIAVHAGRTDWMQAHPGETVAALRAVREGVRWLYDAANREEAVAILAREINVSEAIARQTYELLVEQLRLWSPDLELPPETVQKSITFMAEIGELTPPLPPPSRYMDRRFLEELHRGG